MPNYLLPGVDAYSNNTYYQNIVTWSTTSRTLSANFKLSTGFVCSYCSNFKKTTSICKKWTFDRKLRTQYRLGISLFYASFPLFCYRLLTNSSWGKGKKINAVTQFTELFSFISRDLFYCKCTLHVYLRNSTNNLKLEFAAIAVKRKNIKKMTGNNFPATRYRVTYVLKLIFRKKVD